MEYWSLATGIVFFLLLQVNVSTGTATVYIEVESFDNPTNKKFDYTCCNASCAVPCYYVYQLCFNDPEPQELGCTEGDNVTYYSDGILPQIEYKVQKWTGEFGIKVFVYSLSDGVYDGVDYLLTQQNITLNPQNITLKGGRTSYPTSFAISISYECDPNYYGPGCDVYCKPAERVSGHYTCDNVTGKPICSTGWQGPTCSSPVTPCPGNPPIVPVIPAGSCQALDILFILDSSKSVNDINANNWDYMKAFVKAFVDRVTLGPTSVQIGVIVVSDSAQYRISLSSSYDSDTLKGRIDALPYIGGKTNLRAGLSLARTVGYSQINGGRPGAYQVTVVVYDGGPLSPEYGTWTNEASRLRDMGTDVFVVSLDYYFKQGKVQKTLVEAMASKPWITHLWTDLSDWSKLSTTVAPTVLASAQDACFRKGAQASGSSSTASANVTSSSAVTSSSVMTSTTVSTSSVSTTPSPSGLSSGTSAAPPPTPTLLCSYRGYCSATAVSQRCYCLPGYYGDNCQYIQDPCSPNPCNGGKCTSTAGGSGYTCDCLPGFSGVDCEIVGGPVSCAAESCSGGVTCVTPTPAPQCAAIPEAPCAEYYYGDNCDQFCAPMDNCRRGHFTCDQQGKKVCRAGWKNPTNNCTESDGTPMCAGTVCTNGGTCFNGGCCCPPGFAGPDCSQVFTTATSFSTLGTGTTPQMTSTSVVTGSVTSSSGGSTVTMVTGSEMTTVDPQQALLESLAKFIKENFPFLTPAQKQALVNFLLASNSNGGNSAFADFVLNAQPIYVSDPFPGTGQLTGSMIEMEVFKAVISRVGSSYQLSMTYDFVVTDPQGAVTRLSREQFDIMSQDGDNIDTSLLNLTNQQEIKLYGSYLDQSQQIQIETTLKQVYGLVNPDWKAKTTSRVAIGEVAECLGQNGESMTSVKFWLISGTTIPYQEESNVVTPADADIENILTQRLGPGATISHVTYYKMADCFMLSVLEIVYQEDLPKFAASLEKY